MILFLAFRLQPVIRYGNVQMPKRWIPRKNPTMVQLHIIVTPPIFSKKKKEKKKKKRKERNKQNKQKT